MRGTYHLCLSSHGEVMFRTEADLNRGFNSFALAVLETESRALAEGFMTTHFHSGVQTDNPKDVMRAARYSYSRYFNGKYSRNGRLGERTAFITELKGRQRTMAAVSYIMRQGLHHGLSETAFGYPNCSINCIFQNEFGRVATRSEMPDKSRYLFLPDKMRLPEQYRMDEKGLIFREDIIDVKYVEEMFITPKNFHYHMSRYSDEKWESEQRMEDKDIPTITLDVMEKGVEDNDVTKMKANEKSVPARSTLTDVELCWYIDNSILPHYLRSTENPSIYLLKDHQRTDIANRIYTSIKERKLKNDCGEIVFAPNLNQIRRCMALDYSESKTIF